MNQQPEFIRGNQKSYIRLFCEPHVLNRYEYQMCMYNALTSLLEFQQRSQNGKNYLYYDVSGMQSLDIWLQTQKLKRPFTMILVKGLIRLCKELAEFALDIHQVIFSPKYVMVSAGAEEIKFMYAFPEQENTLCGLEQLLECCIEYLDYEDELLMTQLYYVYENLLEQGHNFSLIMEMERLLEALTEIEVTEIVPDTERKVESNVSQDQSFMMEEKTEKSAVAAKERRNLKRGLWILLLLDIVVMLLWKPFTILKMFFGVAAGCTLLALNCYVLKQEKKKRKQSIESEKSKEFLEEYYNFVQTGNVDEEGTQIISIENSEGVLYNLQNFEPQYIYIGSARKIIGKDSQKVQVCIQHESVSRIHALIVKEGADCIIEDLNSTNGTWVNGKQLEPRVPYVLKQGDKVLLASLEYIFR